MDAPRGEKKIAPLRAPGVHAGRNKNKGTKVDELIRQIKELMIGVSTGKSRIEDKNHEYQELFSSLDSEYRKQKIDNPNRFSDLWEFHAYWKENLPQYSDRRAFIIKLYKTGSQAITEIYDHWTLIHPKIVEVSKSRFSSGHFADSVEAAMKEVNVRVKTIYHKKIGQEEDGAPLMKKAFSVNRPIIALDDNSTETGRNIQQGYMELFSGAMIGIRNPKAHANITITRDRAIHFLFLASLLMYKLDDAGV